MLTFIILLMLFSAAAAGFCNSSWQEISAAAMGSCNDAVQLGIFLAGAMAFWCGLMRVAEKAGITKWVGRALSPLVELLFGDADPEAKKAVSLNLTADLLGLGNAATPTGIRAAQLLDKGSRPRRNTAVLTVLNTASIQLVPVTMGAIRASHGSAAPFEILPAVLVTSLAAAAVGCIVAAALYSGEE